MERNIILLLKLLCTNCEAETCVILLYTLEMNYVMFANLAFSLPQGRARQLLKAGYRTPNDVAAADHVTLCEEIENLFPNQAQKIIGAAKVHTHNHTLV